MERLIFRAFMLFVAFTAVLSSNVYSQNPNWAAPVGSNFQFSANVIAVVHLSDVRSNNAEDVIAVFDNESIRGKGSAVAIGNGQILHFLTVYSNQASDTFALKVYHKGTDQVYEVLQPFIFQSQSIVGRVDNPAVINIYPDNTAPFYLLPVLPQTQLQGYAFDTIEMLNYLVNPNNLAIEWSFIPNVNLTVGFIGSKLHVMAVNGFTGQTGLTVRVSQPSFFNREKRYLETDRSGPIPPSETTILFNVTPVYDAPLWQPTIPSQGIITGSQFDSIPLHDFENQFDGPAILYDYVPVIEENIPNEAIPNWQVTQSFGTTMTVIGQLDYTPKYQFHHEDDVLAAFVGNEIRGIASRNVENGLFYLSIGGSPTLNDTIDLKLYSGAMKRVLDLDSVLVFKSFERIGTAQMPRIFEFAPIVPIVPTSPVNNGIYAMPVNILKPMFIGSVSFNFIALDPAYPQFLKDETIATFCIAADSAGLSIYYQDADGDGLGNPLVSIYNCIQPAGYVTNDDDCDDNPSGTSTISINVLENSGIANDGVICESAMVTLSVNQTAVAYQWSSGQTTQSIEVNPTETTIFTVSVTYLSGCSDVISDTIGLEGKVVKNSANDGFNSLRSVLGCINENDTITYDLPMSQITILTESININKNVTILGTIPIRPHIFIDFNTALNGLIIGANKKLIINNVDIGAIGQTNQAILSGTGTLEINGITNITSP